MEKNQKNGTQVCKIECKKLKWYKSQYKKQKNELKNILIVLHKRGFGVINAETDCRLEPLSYFKED